MTFEEVRRLTIIALFSDDELLDQLVLKGGNALNLIHKISKRTSLDLDFSLEFDFGDLDHARTRIFRALRDRFDSNGYVVFDERLEPKPQLDGPDERPWWGGYELRFKIIEKAKYEKLSPEKRRLDALATGPDQRRVFTVDLSKNEYTVGKREFELENYTIYVYSLEMVVIEKLRAICQQMREYEIGRGRARARDFYDIHLVLTASDIDIASAANLELIRQIFAVKRVPLRLLRLLDGYREFHRPDWPAVVNSVAAPLDDYDVYFDFVAGQVERLQALWVEEPPV